MSKRRRQFKEREVLETLIVYQGVVIPCFRCKEPITARDLKTGNVEKEHLHEVVLGGPDVPMNCRFSHKAAPCHYTVTNGTPATSAGSSQNRIAKATHQNRIDHFTVRDLSLDAKRDRRQARVLGRRPNVRDINE